MMSLYNVLTNHLPIIIKSTPLKTTTACQPFIEDPLLKKIVLKKTATLIVH